MKLLIFSGTTEGRLLSRALADRGAEVTVCVATEYGTEEQGVYPGVTVDAGRKNAAEMETLLRGFSLCIDATHPYAVQASANIRAACGAARVPYRRLLRRESAPSDATIVESAAEAAAYLKEKEGNILLTTGSKELSAFSQLGGERLFPRVLPSHEGLRACENAGIPHRNIIAMQGPFSRELNEALIRQYRIRYLVTKDGGAAGGFPEKAAAAKAAGAELILLRRPADSGESYETILSECEERLKCGLP